MVNSAFFGLYRRVTDVQDAVRLLGLDAIRALVLSVNVFSAFDPRRMPFFDGEALWRHSLNIGGFARRITLQTTGDRPAAAAAFLSGMLHDVGKLILAVNFSDAYRKLVAAPEPIGGNTVVQEVEAIGTTHAEIGAYLMGLWGLEPGILAAIAFHHRPLDSGETGFGALTAVHVADGFEHAGPTGDVDQRIDGGYLEAIRKSGELPAWQRACRELEGMAL
jgi:HD-like signal output (HDOD) protein